MLSNAFGIGAMNRLHGWRCNRSHSCYTGGSMGTQQLPSSFSHNEELVLAANETSTKIDIWDGASLAQVGVTHSPPQRQQQRTAVRRLCTPGRSSNRWLRFEPSSVARSGELRQSLPGHGGIVRWIETHASDSGLACVQ